MSAPPSSTIWICSASRAKSAERIDGAMSTRGSVMGWNLWLSRFRLGFRGWRLQVGLRLDRAGLISLHALPVRALVLVLALVAVRNRDRVRVRVLVLVLVLVLRLLVGV